MNVYSIITRKIQYMTSKFSSSMGKANDKKYIALIVDDDPVMAGIAKKYLSKNGFVVEIVNNGLEAIDHYYGGNKFDVVIMDMEMPIMDGFQATKDLRALEVKCPIIGMSAATSEAKIRAFVEAGLDDFHTKPMNINKVAAIINLLKNYKC